MITWQLAFKIIKLYEYEFKLLNKIENKTKKKQSFFEEYSQLHACFPLYMWTICKEADLVCCKRSLPPNILKIYP